MVALKLAVSTTLIALLIYLVEWDQAAEVVASTKAVWLVGSGILLMLVIFMDGLRMSWMVPVRNLPLTEHLRLALRSTFVMQFGFGVLTADAYRTAGYVARSGTLLKPAFHVAAARIAGLSSIGVVALAASVLLVNSEDAAIHELGTRIVTIVTSVVLVILVVLACFLSILKKRRNDVPDWGVTALDALRAVTPGIWVLSMTIVVIKGLSFACILVAIGQSVPLQVPFLASIAASLTSMLPIAFGGLGVKEGALSGTAVIFGIPIAAAVSAAIFLRIVTILTSIFGFLLSFLIPEHVSH